MPNKTTMKLINQISQLIKTHRSVLESNETPIMETRIKAHIEYLKAASDDLTKEIANEPNKTELKAKFEEELFRLDEEIAREEVCSTFDWYDDHYYEKIYLGQRDACKELLALL